jgi:hypothetical protein
MPSSYPGQQVAPTGSKKLPDALEMFSLTQTVLGDQDCVGGDIPKFGLWGSEPQSTNIWTNVWRESSVSVFAQGLQGGI